MLGFVELCERIDERLAHPARRPARAGRPAHRRASAAPRSVDAADGPARRRPTCDAGRRRAAGGVRRRVGRVRRRAEVPAADGARRRSRAAARPRRRSSARRPHHHARRHGGRRHLRPPRRRLRPLLGRRRVARAALREDALRPRAARSGSTSTPGRSPASRRGTARCSTETIELRAPRPAPARRRLLLGRGRRQRGRGGQVLRVDRPTRSATVLGDGRRRGAPTGTAFRPGGNFEHGTTILNRMHARGELARPARRRGGPASAVRGAGAAGAPRARRQGAHRVERLCSSPRWPRPAPPPASRRGSRPPSRPAEFLLANLRGRTGAGCARGRRDAGARHLAYAADHAALVDAFTRLAEATGQARWIDEARADRRRAARPVLGRRARRRVHHRATTPRRSSPAPRT